MWSPSQNWRVTLQPDAWVATSGSSGTATATLTTTTTAGPAWVTVGPTWDTTAPTWTFEPLTAEPWTAAWTAAPWPSQDDPATVFRLTPPDPDVADAQCRCRRCRAPDPPAEHLSPSRRAIHLDE